MKKTPNSLYYRFYWEFLQIENDCLQLECFVSFTGIGAEDFEILMLVNEHLMVQCPAYSHEAIRRDYTGEYMAPPYNFRISINHISQCENVKCTPYVKIGGQLLELTATMSGRFFPVSGTFKESYAISAGWLVQMKGNTLMLKQDGKKLQEDQEERFLQELGSLPGEAAKEAIFYRRAYHLMKPALPREIWIFSDRINKADDNGEALFRYLSSHRCQADCYYFLQKDSPDFERLSKYGQVIEYLSPRHKLIHLLANKLISSQADAFVDNPFLDQLEFYRDILCSQKQIFLQHGVIKDDLSGWLGRHNKNLALFLTSTPTEHKSVLQGNYHYDEKVVKLTGLPRYDNLMAGREENLITIMPTWRFYLIDKEKADYAEGIYSYKEEFIQSPFFQFYNKLLNDERLLKAASIHGYRIQVMLHPNLQPVTQLFDHQSQIEFLPLSTPYHEIFKKSKLIVSDYSSVTFDFAYMRKPLIYCHFDYDTFMQKHIYDNKKRFFDYERDGFGEVKYTLTETVNCLIGYLENDCQLKDIYRQRIESFFAYHDQSNCKRAYDAIIDMN